MGFARVLIANRGEIAIRIARAANAMGIESVAIFAPVDANALHARVADQAHEIQSDADAVGAYLDIEAILKIAADTGCDCVHPGYGFLSENTNFAERCHAAGMKFIGPAPEALALFGDKVRAKRLAIEQGIPVIPGSEQALDGASAAASTAQEIGYPVMLKAAAGGGGRGMRAVFEPDELAVAFERCQSEAAAAFADGAVFIEKLIENPRHIEVQVVADAEHRAVHLYERDCSVQLRNQKVVEVAPAPNLDQGLRDKLLADAVRLVEAANFANAGTVEFLVVPESSSYYFIECNPRIQVEHTITEQVTNVDLVETQFAIAAGRTIDDLGLATVSTPRGFAIQARVVARGAGTINAYKEPSGAGIRVDACGYAGLTPPPQFDPLLAKVITTSRTTDFGAAASRAAKALEEFHVGGLPTNIEQLHAILKHGDFQNGDARTSFLADHPEVVNAKLDRPTAAVAFLQQQATAIGAAGAGSVVTATSPEAQGLSVGDGERGAECPMAGSVVDVQIKPGDKVSTGDTLIVVSAMKMESAVSAPCAGTIVAIQDLTPGDNVAAGQVVVTILVDADADASSEYGDQTWAPVLSEVAELKALALKRLEPGSNDPGVVRQRSRGKLTCRERIDLFLDSGSFREVGSVAGFATYDEFGDIAAFTPANSVGGWGKVSGRELVVCADDFTSRGGHADGAIGAKSGYLDRLAIEMRIPSVRMLDGSSGGGSVAAMVPAQKKEGESSAEESSGAIKAGRPRVAGGGGSFLPGHLGSNMYAEQLTTVPVVNMLLGIGAAKAVLGHFSVMVRDISQLFVAGPPVVSHAMGYDITKEDLGGWHIHCTNGSVDNLAENEEEATQMASRFLSYLPGSVYEVPPIAPADPADPPERREEELFTLVPRKRTMTFDMRKAIRLISDRESFFEVGPLWGTDQITGFVRLNGHPVGIIASDSQHANGGALTADGCDKLKRHLDLCDLFHVPVLNLVDNPGFAVGLEHELAGTIRKGGEWMVAFAQVTVPIFTVVMRRSFGVAGNNYATPRSRPSMRVAWPAADVGGIPPEGGIEAAYKRQLAEAEDPVALRAEIEARIESARGPVGPLGKFQMEEMIDPRDTRRYVCEWVESAYRIVSQPSRLGPRALQFRP